MWTLIITICSTYGTSSTHSVPGFTSEAAAVKAMELHQKSVDDLVPIRYAVVPMGDAK